MIVCCYIISCNDGTFYVGISKGIIQRFSQHKAHKTSYFRYRSAVSVVWIRFFDSYKLARICEKWIKSIGAKKFMCKFP